jgi:hypothetical protein
VESETFTPKTKIVWNGDKVRLSDLPVLAFAREHKAILMRWPSSLSFSTFDIRNFNEPVRLAEAADEYVREFATGTAGANWALGRESGQRNYIPEMNPAWSACSTSDLGCLQAYVDLVARTDLWAQGVYEEDGLDVEAVTRDPVHTPAMQCESAPHEAYPTVLTFVQDTPAGVRFRPVKVWVPDYPANWKSAQLMPTPGHRGRWAYTIPGASLDELFN